MATAGAVSQPTGSSKIETAWSGLPETALDEEAMLVVRHYNRRSSARDSARTQRRLLWQFDILPALKDGDSYRA